MRDVLTQLLQATQQQQAQSGTTPQAGTTAGEPNPAASRPPQATGSVSILSKNYVVQLVNPGGTSPISQLQAQQAQGTATPLTPLQPVTPIYHQIRASTSPAFNVNSNTQTFGGNTGSTQTYWTLTGLGTGTWFIQFRSSYDGINWNAWRNANGGTALGGLINQVTTEDAGNSEWALLTLPGGLVFGVGAAVIEDQEIFDLAEQVFSSGMLAHAAPNGFTANANITFGIVKCEVDLQVPSVPAAGIPDYPVEIRMQYGSSGYTSPGSANVFAIAFDPTNENVTLYPEPGGSTVWAVFRLPGGARIAIGQGKNSDGNTIWTPPSLTWLSSARSMGIATPTGATGPGSQPLTGINECHLTGFTLASKYQGDGGATWSSDANWLCIAWEQGAPVQTVGGHPFLTIPLQGGHSMVIGGGTSPNATLLTMPAGYTNAQNTLSIATPDGCDPVGNHLRGVQQCSLIGFETSLFYSDGSNTWSGNVSWMIAAWK